MIASEIVDIASEFIAISGPSSSVRGSIRRRMATNVVSPREFAFRGRGLEVRCPKSCTSWKTGTRPRAEDSLRYYAFGKLHSAELRP